MKTIERMKLSERLKEETRQAHMETEKLIIPGIKSLDSQGSYAALLHIFYGYFKPVEEKIEQYIAPSVVPDFVERRKADTILKDIVSVGQKPDPALCADLPEIKNAAGALGAMYVLEGSTLGGKHISKMIIGKLGLTGIDGTDFFTGYGAETDNKWIEFKNVLDHYTGSHQEENEVIGAANETFMKFKNWIEVNRRTNDANE